MGNGQTSPVHHTHVRLGGGPSQETLTESMVVGRRVNLQTKPPRGDQPFSKSSPGPSLGSMFSSSTSLTPSVSSRRPSESSTFTPTADHHVSPAVGRRPSGGRHYGEKPVLSELLQTSPMPGPSSSPHRHQQPRKRGKPTGHNHYARAHPRTINPAAMKRQMGATEPFDGTISFVNKGFRPNRDRGSVGAQHRHVWKKHPTLADVERDPERYIPSMQKQVRSIEICIEGHKFPLRVPRHIADPLMEQHPRRLSGHSRTEISSEGGPDGHCDSVNNRGSGVPINAIDPIMLCELEDHQFHFVRTNGSVVAYNIESLVDYMLATGQFCEPETRLQFTDEMLSEMDRIAKEAGIDKPSVLYARHNANIFEESYFKRDALLGLERCLGEIVNSMLEVIETYDEEDGQMQLIMVLFPQFADHYSKMQAADAEYASQSLDHFQEFVQGPPNKPTEDETGLLGIVLNFFDEVCDGQQGAEMFGFAESEH